MFELLTDQLGLFADTTSALTTMRNYVTPTVQLFIAVATIACTFFVVQGGMLYMSSAGRPDTLLHAKRIIRNALIGLSIILTATVITSLLSNAYGAQSAVQEASLPSLTAITPTQQSNGLVEVLITAVIGFLNSIIQTIAAPFLDALNFFTTSTPLLVKNGSVFNLWLVMVGITDILFILILALLGFHVMSATSLGFDEIDIKALLPRIVLIFLLINTSIFIIDGFIELSNVLISALTQVSGSQSVWKTLTTVVQESGSQSLAALLLMMAFLIFALILLVYYVGRLVTLFIGAVLSPLVLLLWLTPGFRDFSETAAKTYLTTIFVLFVHVVILTLAASLFSGLSTTQNTTAPNILMALVVGLATIIALLKTQGVMMQFSFVSGGARSARKLSGQFMNGVSVMTRKGTAGATRAGSAASSTVERIRRSSGGAKPQSFSVSSPRIPAHQQPSLKITRTPGTQSDGATHATLSAQSRKDALSASVSKPTNQEKR